MRPALRSVLLLILAALPALFVGSARAQGAGRSMDIELSIRSAGMGLASNAVFWGGGSAWGNPALLGYERGVRYEWTRSRLVPDLADDVFITSRQWKLGGGGFGLSLAGSPHGVSLEYGESEYTDPGGNPIGTFSSHEWVDGWGFGVNALEAVEQVAILFGGEPRRLSRHVELSGGMNFKRVGLWLGPMFGGAGLARTDARDAGGLLRVTPFDQLESGTAAPLRIDLAYGLSWLSYNDDAELTFLLESDRVTRHRRGGIAARVGLNLPAFRARLQGGGAGAEWLRGFSPLLSLSLAADHAKIDGGDGTPAYETDGKGLELTFANVLSWRHGSYEDLDGGIDDSTWGWALAIPIGPWGGARYEEARFPQSSGFDHVRRRAARAWLDPTAIWRSARANR